MAIKKPSSTFWLVSVFSISILTIGLTLFFAYCLNQTLKDIDIKQNDRMESIMLADELRQSSDDLTNFARLYTITSDERWSRYYFNVLDVRNGKIGRPIDYGTVYWDVQIPNKNFNISGGTPASLISRMKSLNFTDSEFALLEKSKSNSDELVKIETNAFDEIGLMKDYIGSMPDNISIKFHQNISNTLFDTAYIKAKSYIMSPIKEFIKSVNERTYNSLSESLSQSIVYMILTIISTIASLVSVIFLWVVIITSKRKNTNLLGSLEKKNTYLEHAAKIIRHDMHSGINTYIPRGLTSLTRRLSETQIADLKIDAPLKMIKEGLRHTQKVYKGVYEFTNLVKKDVVLNRSDYDLKSILTDYLSATSYFSQVEIGDIGTASVNEPLFCTAVDNLIRNGLKYNDSDSKLIKIYLKDNTLFIEDNGRGLSNEDLKMLSEPYVRKKDQKEKGSGLGLNICIAILEEHGFTLTAEKILADSSHFFKDLERLESKIINNPSSYRYDRKLVELAAAKSNFVGALTTKIGGASTNRLWVGFEPSNKPIIKGTKIKIKIK